MSSVPSTRVLGIDPGLNTTGYCVLEVRDVGPRIVEAGMIRPTEGLEREDLPGRLLALSQSILDVIDQLSPTQMAIEQLYAHYEHPRTAILMGHARGAILLSAAMRKVPVADYAATRIKKTITGSGRASKEQIQLAMLRELRLDQLPEPADVADAMAIALCHYYLQGEDKPAMSNRRAGVGVNLAALRAATQQNKGD